jgi:predicted metal-dependent peptidase
LLYWDSRVCQHEKYDPDQFDGLLRSTRPKGGGGTMPQCIVDYIKAHKIKADCCVVLTDGMVSGWGNGWPCPVLWAITSDVVAKVGKSVKI